MHGLPARPIFASEDVVPLTDPNMPPPPIPTPTITSNAIAGPSRPTPSKTECGICSNPPKYTCPRCSIATCSLPCSKAHKETFSCSGQRDPTAFVSLKGVSEGTWSDDYKYLEEGRRRVSEWGGTLPKGAVLLPDPRDKRARGRGRGDAREGLKRALRDQGVEVEFMPDGMERRKKNQSSWSAKTGNLALTVHLKLDISLSTDGSEFKPIYHPRVALLSGQGELPTLSSLLSADVELSSKDLIWALPYHTSSQEENSAGRAKKFFPPLDPALILRDALKGTAFVEFPTIHIFSRTTWYERLEKGEYETMDCHQPRVDEAWRGGAAVDSGWGAKRKTPAAALPVGAASDGEVKRAKAEPQTGSGLIGLGDYGSDDDDD